jgi:hypothetical protein
MGVIIEGPYFIRQPAPIDLTGHVNMTAGSAAVAVIPICRILGIPKFSNLLISVLLFILQNIYRRRWKYFPSARRHARGFKSSASRQEVTSDSSQCPNTTLTRQLVKEDWDV